MVPGTPLDETFDTMDLHQKEQILAQTAKMLKALQDCQLPGSITGFGSVTFDGNGRNVTTAILALGSDLGPHSKVD